MNITYYERPFDILFDRHVVDFAVLKQWHFRRMKEAESFNL